MSGCFPESGDVRWGTDSSGVRMVAAGSSVEIDAAGLEADAFVSMLGGQEGPAVWSWAIAEIDADCAFGIQTADGEASFLYASDGRLIVDGSVVRTGPALKAGDSLVLYIDPEEEKAVFLLNGVPV